MCHLAKGKKVEGITFQEAKRGRYQQSNHMISICLKISGRKEGKKRVRISHVRYDKIKTWYNTKSPVSKSSKREVSLWIRMERPVHESDMLVVSAPVVLNSLVVFVLADQKFWNFFWEGEAADNFSSRLYFLHRRLHDFEVFLSLISFSVQKLQVT